MFGAERGQGNTLICIRGFTPVKVLFFALAPGIVMCNFRSIPIYALFSLIVPLLSKSQTLLSNHATVLKLFVLPILLFSPRSSHFFHCCPLSLHCFLPFLPSKAHLLFLWVTQKTHTHTHKVLITRNGLREGLLVCSQVMIFNLSLSNTRRQDKMLCWWFYF